MSSEWWKKLKRAFSQLDEEYSQGQQHKPAQKWNDLLIRIAREIERVMLAEMLEPPGEPVYIPPEYLVFLSPADDAALQGDRRLGFLRGLRNITAERSHRVVGSGKAQVDQVSVELRVDSSLEEDHFFVRASWDVAQDQTTILAEPPRLGFDSDDESTHLLIDDEATVVRRDPLFYILVRSENSSRPHLQKIFKPQVRIGRGGKRVPVDVALPEDRQVSRLHAILRQKPDGFEITMKGKNPMLVGERRVQPGETVSVGPGESIRIGVYTLRLTSGVGDNGGEQEAIENESR